MFRLRRPINLCLCGIGGFGVSITRALEKIAGANLVYGYHPDATKATSWDATKGTSQLEEALEDRRVDAILIATPTLSHLDLLKRCLPYRKAIYVEKPLVNNLDEVDELLALYRNLDSPPPVFVGFKQRYIPVMRTIKTMLESGQLGEIVNVNMVFSHGGVYTLPETSWRLHEEFHKEGPLNIRGIHLFDTVHYLFGAVKQVFASLQNFSKKSLVPDANACLFTLCNRATVFLTANYCVPSDSLITITGTEGCLYMDRGWAAVRRGRDRNREPSKKDLLMESEPSDAVVESLYHFLSSFEEEKGFETGLQEGINANILLDACFRSSVLNIPIDLADYPLYQLSVR